ncbi:MAG: hypothetical protein ACR2Q4_02470 [Geminicoccaceae bacterium]
MKVKTVQIETIDPFIVYAIGAISGGIMGCTVGVVLGWWMWA